MSRDSPSTGWLHSIRNCIKEKKPKAAILTYIYSRRSSNIAIAAVPLLFKACASLSMHDFGKALHSEILKSGIECDVMVGTSLVDIYGKCRDILSAGKVFDDMPVRNVISWNAMIGGYMRNGNPGAASKLFGMMSARQLFDVMPDGLKTVVTWTVMVDMYASNGDMETAREMFEMMTVRNFYTWTVMISGYFKKGDVAKATEVFNEMNLRNLVNWNSLISGYAQNGMCKEVMEAFTRMQEDGFEPNEVTFVGVLSACAQTGTLEFGKEIHERILNSRIEPNEFVINALLDMYAKCGDLVTARLVFEGALVKNSATWNSLIAGFAIHGQCKEAIEFFDRMKESGVKPNEVTFLSVLSACAYGGLVEEGLESFHKMETYGVKRNIKHYGCLVDLLGRSGKLQDAFNLVKGMPEEPNDSVIRTLLGACRTHSDTMMTENVFGFISELSHHGSHDEAHYRLLSNIYAASEIWEMAERVRVTYLANGTVKTTGCSVLMV